jgi:hypothetical protein
LVENLITGGEEKIIGVLIRKGSAKLRKIGARIAKEGFLIIKSETNSSSEKGRKVKIYCSIRIGAERTKVSCGLKGLGRIRGNLLSK